MNEAPFLRDLTAPHASQQELSTWFSTPFEQRSKGLRLLDYGGVPIVGYMLTKQDDEGHYLSMDFEFMTRQGPYTVNVIELLRLLNNKDTILFLHAAMDWSCEMATIIHEQYMSKRGLMVIQALVDLWCDQRPELAPALCS